MLQSIAHSKIVFGVAPPASSSHLQHQRRTALVSVARPESSSHSQSSLHSQRHLHTPASSLHNWPLQTPILTLPEEVKFHLGPTSVVVWSNSSLRKGPRFES
ncbi:hypothetical protein L3X38_014512 [Prunus dulcis]|uniref:Uncharacterized protein n=1 Tax=Prunus dulcis TaxID=3755 RepID=A0AAD4WNX6_PRUDU|nr:hypothetical protein L3X38_014512 [Prunus dulcis]